MTEKMNTAAALFTFTKKELDHLSVCSVISVVDKNVSSFFIHDRDHRAHREGILTTKMNNLSLCALWRIKKLEIFLSTTETTEIIDFLMHNCIYEA